MLLWIFPRHPETKTSNFFPSDLDLPGKLPAILCTRWPILWAGQRVLLTYLYANNAALFPFSLPFFRCGICGVFWGFKVCLGFLLGHFSVHSGDFWEFWREFGVVIVECWRVPEIMNHQLLPLPPLCPLHSPAPPLWRLVQGREVAPRPLGILGTAPSI